MLKIDENQLTKLYYSIGEVADIFEVNTSLIRFWEKEFNSIKPKKNKKGNRLFTSKDILKIETIYYLVKEKGYTLDGARNELKNKNVVIEEGDDVENTILLNRLTLIKDRLLAMKSAN